MKIFISAMPGAGNLGDDLISKILIKKIFQKYPNAKIGVLANRHFQNKETFNSGNKVEILQKPSFRKLNKYLVERRRIINFVKQSDVYLVGGGGLFQDTHFLFTIHRYLKYLFFNRKIKLVTVGLGVGPISSKLNKFYLRNLIDRFSHIQVRDLESKEILLDLLGTSTLDVIDINTDLVIGETLNEEFPRESEITAGKKILGCSIRPWNNIEPRKIATFIERALEVTECDYCNFFVFEYGENNSSEEELANKISRILNNKGICSKVFVYSKDTLTNFVENYKKVHFGIAMRYHANIIWQTLGIPILPISYAPKVKSLYEENDKKCFDIEDIEKIEFSIDLFQKIKFNSCFQLPDLTNLKTSSSSIRHYLLMLFFNILDFFVKIWNSLLIRI